MLRSLIEELPRIASEGRQEAQRIIERLSSGTRIGLQTNELVLPRKDVSGFFRGQVPNIPNDFNAALDGGTWMNRLVYGDNLLTMQALLAGDPQTGLPSLRGKVDLIYIDPPFDSKADYRTKVTLPGLNLQQKPTVIEQFAYADTWEEGTISYLKVLYPRLILMKELLSDTGSIYVQTDWHVCHYVKLIMDDIFGKDNFRNEIIWAYSTLGRPKDRFALKHDNIYWYGKSKNAFFNENEAKIPYTQQYIDSHFRDVDEKGKQCRKRFDAGKWRIYYPDEGMIPNDVWDIPYENSMSRLRVNYATQKPEALLERIIKSTSTEGDLVCDFFGGSGVTAAVANKLGRRFIHCDIGLNSIQTARDRLVTDGAEFDVLEIKDGVQLYRNPVQTMDKIKSLIPGLKSEDDLDSFWEGAISDSKLGMIPVYVPNLMDSSSKLLDVVLMNRILHQAIPDLDSSVKKVIVYYIDITDEDEIRRFIAADDSTTVEIELRDLKTVLDDVAIGDEVSFHCTEVHDDLFGGWQVMIDSFVSDRVLQKITEFNNKARMNASPKKPFKPIEISEEGLELIEYLSLDCTAADDAWHSDSEIKIDKLGYVVRNGEKTKEFWDGAIRSEKKPLRLKIRNICGDETMWEI